MESIDIYKKKLIYKANNRGWKETDLLLGKFLIKCIDDFKKEDLLMLDSILDEADGDIFNWITKKTTIPAKHDNHIMSLLKNFKVTG